MDSRQDAGRHLFAHVTLSESPRFSEFDHAPSFTPLVNHSSPYIIEGGTGGKHVLPPVKAGC